MTDEISVQYFTGKGGAINDARVTMADIQRGYWEEPSGRRYQLTGEAYEQARRAQTQEEISEISRASTAASEQKYEQIRANVQAKREQLREGFAGKFDEQGIKMASAPVGQYVPTKPEELKIKYLQSPTAQWESEKSFLEKVESVQHAVTRPTTFRGQIVQAPQSLEPPAQNNIFPLGIGNIKRETPERKYNLPASRVGRNESEFYVHPRLGQMIPADIAEELSAERQKNVLAEISPKTVTLSSMSRRVYEGARGGSERIRNIKVDTGFLPPEIKESFGFKAGKTVFQKGRESAARLTEFAGTAPGTVEVFGKTAIKEPAKVPGMLVVGGAMFAGGLARQAKEEPAQMVSDIVFTAGVFKGVSAGAKLAKPAMLSSKVLRGKVGGNAITPTKPKPTTWNKVPTKEYLQAQYKQYDPFASGRVKTGYEVPKITGEKFNIQGAGKDWNKVPTKEYIQAKYQEMNIFRGGDIKQIATVLKARPTAPRLPRQIRPMGLLRTALPKQRLLPKQLSINAPARGLTITEIKTPPKPQGMEIKTRTGQVLIQKTKTIQKQKVEVIQAPKVMPRIKTKTMAVLLPKNVLGIHQKASRKAVQVPLVRNILNIHQKSIQMSKPAVLSRILSGVYATTKPTVSQRAVITQAPKSDYKPASAMSILPLMATKSLSKQVPKSVFKTMVRTRPSLRATEIMIRKPPRKQARRELPSYFSKKRKKSGFGAFRETAAVASPLQIFKGL